MMKKFVFLLAAVLFLFSLNACGGGTKDASGSSAASTATAAGATTTGSATVAAGATPTTSATTKASTEPKATATPKASEEPEEADEPTDADAADGSGLNTDGYYNMVLRGDAGEFMGAASLYIGSDGTAVFYLTDSEPTNATYTVDGDTLTATSDGDGNTTIMTIEDGGETLVTETGERLAFSHDENAVESTADESDFMLSFVYTTYYLDGISDSEAFYFDQDGEAEWEYPMGNEDIDSLTGTYVIEYPDAVHVTVDGMDEVTLSIHGNGAELHIDDRDAVFMPENYLNPPDAADDTDEADDAGALSTYTYYNMDGDSESYSLYFFDSGTVDWDYPGEDTRQGYYTVEGDTLTIEWNDSEQTEVYTIEDDGASVLSEAGERFIME
jgi:hypothetical protein